MKSFIAHKARYGRFTNLLRNYDNIPVIEFMRNVFDGVFIRFLPFEHCIHILLIQFDVNLSQPIH